jgi:hypothetical protein
VIPYAIHPTISAIIPAFVGILLVGLGAVALNPGARKHAMHVAVIVGLLGFLLAAGRLASVLASGKTPTPLGGTSLGLMALLCGVFVALCVRSFIQARRQRLAGVEPAVPSDRS